MNAVEKGKRAVAEKLREQYRSEYETTAPVEDWLPQASELIDAWLFASNPVGEPETIYDEYHRLREAAWWVVMSWDTESTQHGSMPALRRALGLPGHRPTREEALERLQAYLADRRYPVPVIDDRNAR